MIRTTRFRFVLSTMVLVALIIVIFVGSVIIINYQSARDEAYKRLVLLLDNHTQQLGAPMRQRTSVFICSFDQKGSLIGVSELTDYAGAFTSQTEAAEFLNSAFADGKVNNARQVEDNVYYGRQGSLFYVAVTNEQQLSVRVAVVDRRAEEALLDKNAVVLAVVSAVALLAVFVIVWFWSKVVVRPVEQAFDKQKRFISDASHELKTPVTIIRANAEAWQSDEARSDEWSQNIISQTDRLTSLVEDMLSLARLEERKAEKTDVNASSVIEAAALEFEPLAYESGKQFRCEVAADITLLASAEELRRLTLLLCDNAVKYSDTFVDISFKKNGKHSVLTVTNDGCQVPQENKDKIFERFYRQDGSRTRSTGGSGLGLATAQAICQSNKWKIFADCKLGGNMQIQVWF